MSNPSSSEASGPAPIEAIDVLVTDSEIRPADHASLTECGVEVILAQEHP